MENQIGARIRELREISDMTVGEMADALRVPVDTYCRYEESGTDIPISVLYHLSVMYSMDMTELLTGKAAHVDSIFVVKQGQGQAVDRYPGYRFSNLSHNFKHRMMEPLLVTVDECADDPVLVTHEGQEFNFVLDGTLELLYEGRRWTLSQGDCVYFDPRRPHGQKGIGGPATFLTVIAEEKPHVE